MNESRYAQAVHWLERYLLPERTRQGLAALVVGLLSGTGVLVFKALIRGLEYGLYDELGRKLLPGLIVLLPALGGLAVGLIRRYWLVEERYIGVPGIIEAVALNSGKLRYKRTPLKALVAAISIGSGAPVGPEDPSIQIGANIGSMIGQWTRSSEESTRTLVAAGAAAGVAAVFNAPIAGVFFAIEIVLGELATSQLGLVILGSVVASVVTRVIFGSSPAFQIPAYDFHSPIELLFYLGLGLLAALVSIIYIRALYWSYDLFQRIRLPSWSKPALVGLAIGLSGLVFPQLLGDSYEATGNILLGIAPIPALLFLLLGLKILLTSTSLGAGFLGGIFAPALFMGAALGHAYGTLLDQLFPALALTPSAFALVGMAAVLSGTIGAPVTAIMLLFEMTNDYRIVLPLMFAAVLSDLIAEAIEPETAYTLSLARKGIHLKRSRDTDVLETLTVAEVMDKSPLTVTTNLPLRMVSAIMAQLHTNGVAVLTPQGELYGVITVRDIEQAAEKNPANLNQPIEAFCTRDLLTAFPDETVQEALVRMGSRGVGRMPIVDRQAPTRLIGWIHRADILRAYEIALARRASHYRRREQRHLEAVSGTRIFELEVQPGSPADQRRVSEIAWPRESLLASLQRRHELIIPRGQTQLQAGDRLAVVANPEDELLLRQLIEGTKK